jgi:hypothetical protein
MARKGKQKKSLGIVPRALLRGAIAGAIPACALTGCGSDSGTAPDAAERDVAADTRAQPDAAADTRAQPDAATDSPLFGVDGPAFSVAAPFDAGRDGPLFGVATDLIVRPDAGADGDHPHDAIFFSVDAPSFKG